MVTSLGVLSVAAPMRGEQPTHARLRLGGGDCLAPAQAGWQAGTPSGPAPREPGVFAPAGAVPCARSHGWPCAVVFGAGLASAPGPVAPRHSVHELCCPAGHSMAGWRGLGGWARRIANSVCRRQQPGGGRAQADHACVREAWHASIPTAVERARGHPAPGGGSGRTRCLQYIAYGRCRRRARGSGGNRELDYPMGWTVVG